MAAVMEAVQCWGNDFDESVNFGPGGWMQEAHELLKQDYAERALEISSKEHKSSEDRSDLSRFFALHMMAKANLDLGDLTEARGLCEKATLELMEKPDKRQEAFVLHTLAKVYLQLYLADNAKDYAERSLAIFKEENIKVAEASVLLTLAKISLAKGCRQESLSTLTKSLEIFQNCQELEGELCVRRVQSCVYSQLRRFMEAQAAAEAALKLSERLQDADKVCSATLLMAEVHSACEEPKLAEDQLKKAISHFNSTGKRRQEARVLRRLAHMCLEGRDYENAWSHVQEALEISREVSDRKAEALTLSQVAGGHLHSGTHLEGSLQMVEEAIALCKEVGLQEQIADLQVLVAESHLQALFRQAGQKHPQQNALNTQHSWKARLAGKEALAIFTQLGNLKGKAKALSALTLASMEMGNMMDAKAKASHAAEICKQMCDKPGEGNSLLLVARTRMHDNKEEAERLALCGQRLIQQGGGNPQLIADAQQVVDFIRNFTGLAGGESAAVNTELTFKEDRNSTVDAVLDCHEAGIRAAQFEGISSMIMRVEESR
eukprot:TRINITY_DN38299_c0_g1_i1.p1 TRINITY_DN38299_c0_g1~~TRINITY_DN38299_c0_g1_i1.p1  ORF type:complete len:569 (-),score=155.50 TRINITY_DN38299_c0_g1_i1:219-1862(-)